MARVDETVAKVGRGQSRSWPKKVVGKVGRGQSRKSCWPKSVVAKVGRARFLKPLLPLPSPRPTTPLPPPPSGSPLESTAHGSIGFPSQWRCTAGSKGDPEGREGEREVGGEQGPFLCYFSHSSLPSGSPSEPTVQRQCHLPKALSNRMRKTAKKRRSHTQ